jgi:drug/metabolite transporter (DMT)-like permease
MQRLRNWQLFVLAALVWGTTWHAIVYQVAHGTPELGVTLRFGLAGVLVLAFAAWRGDPLRFAARDHGLLALQGAFMYSLSYLCVYHAERHVASGLVAVAYSASPLVTGMGAWLLWRGALTQRFLAGGLLGLLGVALIFWPAFDGVAAPGGGSTTRGAAFAVAAVMLSCVGSLAATRNALRGLPFWPSIGFGMLYGALLSLAVVMLSGQELALPTAGSWWVSLTYLSVAGSVIAFACFLTLQQRVGPGPAATLGVMTPVIALCVSTAFENFQPGLFTLCGVVLAIAGNALMLSPQAASRATE